MNVGRLITEAMKEQRGKDLVRLMHGKLTGSLPYTTQQNLVQRYCWWGWDISGEGGLGRPGWEPK